MKSEWKTITESQTELEIIMDAERIYDASVFYNPKMAINRDLTILILEQLLEDQAIIKLHFSDVFAGTGIRTFRILNELDAEKIDRIDVNDINKKALEIIHRNKEKCKHREKIHVFERPAHKLLANYITQKEKKPNVIDMDPFGSPIEFIDLAMRALRVKGGYLFVTATDLEVLCGRYKDACKRMYNAIPTRNYLCHEIAIRIMLYNIIVTAGRIGLYVEPLISYHFEHFIRVKVKITENKGKANEQHKQIGFVKYCTSCSFYEIAPMDEINETIKCPNCEQKLAKAGPMWTGNLYNKTLIRKMKILNEKKELQTKKKIERMLERIEQELDVPLFYYVPFLKKQFNPQSSIKLDQLVEKLKEQGYMASRTVFEPSGVKTNASYQTVVAIIKNS